MIITCSCNSEYQDMKYGKNKRVFNMKLSNKSGANKFVCTVCGKEVEKSGLLKSKKK